jgi:hypothetical protein
VQAFDCATGVSKQIQVQANLEGMKAGTYAAPDAIVIESNGGNETIGASLTLSQSPELHISPQSLRFDDTPEQVLHLANQGYGVLRVQVIPGEEWIAVNRREWSIKAGRTARVRVRLVDAPPGAEGSIEIHALDGVIRLPVTLHEFE